MMDNEKETPDQEFPYPAVFNLDAHTCGHGHKKHTWGGCRVLVKCADDTWQTCECPGGWEI